MARWSAGAIALVHADLILAKALVRLSSTGRETELTPEAHFFFFERYHRLADYHRRRGHANRARAFQARADEHYRLSGGDGPPYAAAMSMPRPRQWLATSAMARTAHDPGDAA